jgi:hypothetical protein
LSLTSLFLSSGDRDAVTALQDPRSADLFDIKASTEQSGWNRIAVSSSKTTSSSLQSA